MIHIESLVSPGHTVTVDGYSRNILADDYRAVAPDTFAVATRQAGPAPRMFTDGTADLPAFCASALDPALLLQIPALCRHYAAAEPDPAVVHSLFERCAADEHARLDHQGLSDAIGRIRAWASGRMDRKPEQV